MTTPTEPVSDNFCYRHPNRQSFVLCQRCGRTICPDCQTQAPVGVICPECMAQGRAQLKAARPRPTVASLRRRYFGGDSPATYIIIALVTLVSAAQGITNAFDFRIIEELGIYTPQYVDAQHTDAFGNTLFEPWRMLTSAFLHGSLLHYAMNILTMWIFGRALEPLIGSARFVALWIVSALGGSLAVAVLAPNAWVYGASGAVFGLFGAWFVVLRRTRQDMTPMLVLIGINVVMAFMNPGISWEAHVGGFIVGVLCGLLNFVDLDKARKSQLGLWLQIALGVLCIAIPPLLGMLRG